MTSPEPVLLLADSQLLFDRSAREPSALAPISRRLAERGIEHPRAAFFGAANGDVPEFFELFQAAMAAMAAIGGVEVHDCRHIPARPTAEDLDFTANAEVLLFAGGDVLRGWASLSDHGLPERIRQRYYDGAHLIGISAGAVHLGLSFANEAGALSGGLAIVPFLVDAHAEPEWTALKHAVARAGALTRGLGIPTGGGVRYHSDCSLEPLRHPAIAIAIRENGSIDSSLLVPAA